MIEDTLRQLHDKVTRGGPLTAEEEAQLAAWYEKKDQEENAMLTSSSHLPELDTLRSDVESALVRLEVTAQQVRAQAEENDALRRDITALSRCIIQITPFSSKQLHP